MIFLGKITAAIVQWFGEKKERQTIEQDMRVKWYLKRNEDFKRRKGERGEITQKYIIHRKS